MGSAKKFLQLIMALCAVTAVSTFLFAQSITLNNVKRQAFLSCAAEVAMADQGIIPLYLPDERVSHEKEADAHATHQGSDAGVDV